MGPNYLPASQTKAYFVCVCSLSVDIFSTKEFKTFYSKPYLCSIDIYNAANVIYSIVSISGA